VPLDIRLVQLGVEIPPRGAHVSHLLFDHIHSPYFLHMHHFLRLC
jgi:hypothetical protein